MSTSSKPAELFDWIANHKHIRGSRRDDCGLWLQKSSKPTYFCPKTRIIVLEDGVRYLIRRETACKALGLDKTSETILSALPMKPDTV
jgi:hypothetical protein